MILRLGAELSAWRQLRTRPAMRDDSMIRTPPRQVMARRKAPRLRPPSSLCGCTHLIGRRARQRLNERRQPAQEQILAHGGRWKNRPMTGRRQPMANPASKSAITVGHTCAGIRAATTGIWALTHRKPERA